MLETLPTIVGKGPLPDGRRLVLCAGTVVAIVLAGGLVAGRLAGARILAVKAILAVPRKRLPLPCRLGLRGESATRAVQFHDLVRRSCVALLGHVDAN